MIDESIVRLVMISSSMGKDRISEINRRLTLLNLAIFLILLVLISIEEYGNKFFIKISITGLGERHRMHRKLIQQETIIAPQLIIDTKLQFPANFLFGVASSAYQTEGALTEDGRTSSTWDTLFKEYPNRTVDGSIPNLATDSYHRYKDDVKAVKQIGVSKKNFKQLFSFKKRSQFQNYRISISWNRILPNGSLVNQAGIDHYHRVFDEMLANGIEPVVTMFHWDLPQWAQDLGGFPNPIIVDYFEAYAETLYRHFGDKVKEFVSFYRVIKFMIFSYKLLGQKVDDFS